MEVLQPETPFEEVRATRRWGEQVLAICSIVFIAILFIAFKGGIHVGSSNHVGLLPVVRRILDPNYLPGDFNISLRLYHHRVFAYIVAGLSWLLGEDRGLVMLHALGLLLLAGALWWLCRTLRLSLPAYLAVGLFLASGFLWMGWGLEENDFIGNAEVQPPLFAHAFVLLAIASLIRHRQRWAAFCVGMAVLFHLQIGAIATLMVAPLFAVKLMTIGLRETWKLAACYLIPASFALLNLAALLQRGVLRPVSQAWSLPYYIDFRHPHHFELMSAAHGLWVGGHIAMMAAIWWWLRREKRAEARPVGILLASSLMLALLALVHFADYYLVRHDRIANLQMIRLSPLITVFGALSLILAVNLWAKPRGGKLVLVANVILILAGLLWGVRVARASEEGFSLRIHRYAEQDGSWVKLCNWIRENGPRDTVYLTPPGETGFTALTDRSNVVEFKINPDGAMHMAEWFERLSDLTGGRLPAERGLKNRKPLIKAYGQMSEEQLIAAGKKYNARYAVVPKESKVNFEVIHEEGGYKLITLP